MYANALFNNAREFAAHLQELHGVRRGREEEIHSQGPKRESLSRSERQVVFEKTGGRCHICGGKINVDEPWHADHVFAHAQGGTHSVDNYLPAHALCNNYRWFYGAEEFQWILKLGVWLRTQIERENSLALELAEKFVRHEVGRDARRKTRDS